MLPEEGGDFDMFFLLTLGRLPAVRVEVAASTLRSRRNPRIPGRSSLDGTACGSVVG
jgi:hypothetical protein